MRHAIHDGVGRLPQIDACSSCPGLDDCDIVLGTLEVTPYLRTQLLLRRAVDLHDIITLSDERLIHQVVVGPKRREHDDGLGQFVDQLNRLAQLVVAEVMQALVIVINEASSDLPAFRYVRYHELS